MVGACIDLLNPDGDDTAADDTAAVVVAATDGARDNEAGKLEDALSQTNVFLNSLIFGLFVFVIR